MRFELQKTRLHCFSWIPSPSSKNTQEWMEFFQEDGDISPEEFRWGIWDADAMWWQCDGRCKFRLVYLIKQLELLAGWGWNQPFMEKNMAILYLISRWCFKHFLFLTPIWGRFPIWLILSWLWMVSKHMHLLKLVLTGPVFYKKAPYLFGQLRFDLTSILQTDGKPDMEQIDSIAKTIWEKWVQGPFWTCRWRNCLEIH